VGRSRARWSVRALADLVPLICVIALVCAVHLLVSWHETTLPHAVVYHRVGAEHLYFAALIAGLMLFSAAVQLPDRPTVPFTLALALTAGSAAANGAAAIVWGRGVPDYVPVTSLFFLHPSHPVVANSADFGLTAGIALVLLTVLFLPITRPRVESAVEVRVEDADLRDAVDGEVVALG
jgi:hypothetical protein